MYMTNSVNNVKKIITHKQIIYTTHGYVRGCRYYDKHTIYIKKRTMVISQLVSRVSCTIISLPPYSPHEICVDGSPPFKTRIYTGVSY